MKILHTEASLGWGGQEIRILTESAGMIARGHEVLLACPAEATIHREAARYGVPVVALPIGRKRLPGLLALRRLLREQRFDVVNTHSSTDSWLAALACVGLASAPPIVRTRHVSTPLGNRPTTRWLYDRAASCVVTTGEKLREQLISESGLRRVPIVSIPTGIDSKRFRVTEQASARRALDLPEQAFIVGIVATLRSWKGHRFLIDAFAQMRRPQDRLIIVGEGPMGEPLATQVRDLALTDSVLLVGRQNEPEHWFSTFDVMCLPSYANEGVPQSLIQAMMCAIACVTCDVGAIREIARDGETALIIEPQSVPAIAAALTRLRDDPLLRGRLGTAAHAWVLDRHSFERMCDDMLAVFDAVSRGEPALSRLSPRPTSSAGSA